MAWIEKKRKGYLVCWREPDGRRASQKAPNHDAARELKSDVELKLFRGEYVARQDRRTPFGEWAQGVVDGDLSLKDSTRYNYQKDLRALAPLARRPLADVSTTELRKLLTGIAGDSSRANVHRLLAKVFNQAVREGVLPRSPMAPIRRPRPQRKEIVPLTISEVEALLEAASPRYRPAILLAAYGGLRAGEVAGLRPQDVNYLHRRISVVQQVARVGGRRVFSDLKTASSKRTITVPAFVVEGLGKLPLRTSAGNPMDAVVLNKAVQDAARHAGLRPVNFHLLRHTCAALMISQGAHPKQIQAHMGHSSIAITMDVYGHLFPNLADTLADRMAAMRESAAPTGRVVEL